MKVLLCLYLLDKKKFSEQEIDLFKTIENISIPKFPYDGKLLLNRGFKEGKKIGTILSEAEKIWLQKDFNLSKEDFEKIIKYNFNLVRHNLLLKFQSFFHQKVSTVTNSSQLLPIKALPIGL